MKATIFNSFLAITLSGFVLTSCTKENTTDDTTTSTVKTTPSFSNAIGVMVALKTTTYVSAIGMEIPTEVNSAVAAFYDTPGAQQFVDAGTVTLNTLSLKKYDNNSYIYDNLLSPISLNQIKWAVSGKGTIPAINKTVSRSMPDYTGYSTLPVSVTKANGLTINLAGKLSSADSVYVFLVDLKSKYVMKRAGGNAASIVFSASDLAVLQSGNGMIMMAPFNYSLEDYSSKKVYFVNESVYTKINVAIN